VGRQASETPKIPENFADTAKEKGLIVTGNPQLEVLCTSSRRVFRDALWMELDNRGTKHRRAHGGCAAVV
jgi:hypothetical protein